MSQAGPVAEGGRVPIPMVAPVSERRCGRATALGSHRLLAQGRVFEHLPTHPNYLIKRTVQPVRTLLAAGRWKGKMRGNERRSRPRTVPRKHTERVKRPREGEKKRSGVSRREERAVQRVLREVGSPEKAPFEPDPFQLSALESVVHGDCLVCAPTGSGKTWIALEAIARVVETGGRAWYATPLKALSNAKYVELIERFGFEKVGILTGDRKENPQAPIIVGTTEILRNQLYDAMHTGQDMGTDFVVLDEAHYLGDPQRGVVWEETMIYLPQRIGLLLLSATIGNAGQIAEWLRSIRSRECAVVQESERPVPLFHLLLHPSGTLMLLSDQGGSGGRASGVGRARALARRMGRISNGEGGLGQIPRIMDVLRANRLLPAIFFLKSRSDCDRAIELCEAVMQEGPARKPRICRHIDALAALHPHVGLHRQRRCMENAGVAAHHSGQLPTWKWVVESLMAAGLLDAVFATSTVAAGVNFPARSVVFMNSDRFNGVEFVPLDSTEFHQMTGRAGRRGMDRIGFSVMVPGRFMDLSLMTRLSRAPAGPVESQIRIGFSMVLNLLLSHTPSEIRTLLQRSFAAFCSRGQGKRARGASESARVAGRLWLDFSRHLSFLQQEGYVTQDGKLTEEGLWASQLRVDQPLFMAECLRRGLFNGKDPGLLAALAAPFVQDRESDLSLDHHRASTRLIASYGKMLRVLRALVRRQESMGFETRPLCFWPAATVHAWAAGASWEQTLSIARMSEGDLAMLVLRTCEALRQVGSLTTSFPDVAQTARHAQENLLREPLVEP